jgi:hypothetical protein
MHTKFGVKISGKVAYFRRCEDYTKLDLIKESYSYGKWVEVIDDPVRERPLLLVKFNIGVLLSECH